MSEILKETRPKRNVSELAIKVIGVSVGEFVI
jgi:hypothetical protein